jgi:hypothetical protein
VTRSLLSTKIEVWHSRLSSDCGFGIELEWSSKLTIGGCAKQEPSSMPPIALIILGVPPKMRETSHTMTKRKEEHLLHCTLHVLCNTSFSSWWFCFDIAFKCMTLH